MRVKYSHAPVGDRRRLVGLLDAADDLVVDALAQRREVRERGVGVRVLGLEVRDHLGVVAVAEPEPVSTRSSPWCAQRVGRARRDGRSGLGHAGSGSRAESETGSVVGDPTGTLDRRWNPPPIPTPDRTTPVGHPDRRHRGRARRASPTTPTASCPRSCRRQGTGEVLMFAWMNDDALRRTLETGPHVVLEPEPPGVLVQGRDLGRPPVRARGLLRLRRRRAAVRRRAGGPGRLPHRRAQLLLPGLRRRRRRPSTV